MWRAVRLRIGPSGEEAIELVEPRTVGMFSAFYPEVGGSDATDVVLGHGPSSPSLAPWLPRTARRSLGKIERHSCSLRWPATFPERLIRSYTQSGKWRG